METSNSIDDALARAEREAQTALTEARVARARLMNMSSRYARLTTDEPDAAEPSETEMHEVQSQARPPETGAGESAAREFVWGVSVAENAESDGGGVGSSSGSEGDGGNGGGGDSGGLDACTLLTLLEANPESDPATLADVLEAMLPSGGEAEAAFPLSVAHAVARLRGGDLAARELLEEIAAQAQAQAAAAEDAPEMTMSEKGAFLGSVAFSPVGVPGLVVGGALGFAAGYFAEQVDAAREHVARAYATRVQRERRVESERANTRKALEALETVSVHSDDPEEAARTSADLTAFLCAPCNTRCADCSARIKRPADAWVSTSLGVVVCVNCAAAHRSLGTSVSRIKSPVYDQWDVPMATALLAKGNDRGAADYYATPPARMPGPKAPMEERRAHVREKYVRLRWATPELRAARQETLAKRPRKAASARRMASLSSDHAA
mmetsp:Transcript_13262/g.42046  ORF Transcript_13262/g.42046 Transcript_13262/m.42046 type:complete len:439 (-) Transcript_13262:138-1454(-)